MTALPCIAQCARYEAYAVQPSYLARNSIDYVLALLNLEFVRILTDGLPLFCCSNLIVGIEEGFPEVSHAEHKICANEHGFQRDRIMEIALYHLNALC